MSFFLQNNKYDFPVDLVYLWCDGSDPDFAYRRAKALSEVNGSEFDPDAVTVERWTDHDELKYSLRSVCKFLPWINNIYILMNQKPPAWLKADVPGVICVQHRDIMQGNEKCFNSTAIESYIHKIPGLAEHFIFTNDDVFVGAPLHKSYFFTKKGQAIQYVRKSKIMRGRLNDESFHDLLNDSTWKSQYERMIVKINKILFDEFDKELCVFPGHLMDAYNRSVLEEQVEDSPLHKYVIETRKQMFRHEEDLQRSAYSWRAALLNKLTLKYLPLSRPRLERYFPSYGQPRVCGNVSDFKLLRIGKTPLFITKKYNTG